MKPFYFLIFFLIIATCNAQKSQSYNFNNTSLNEVIKHLEKQHNVTFSYALDVIKDKQITLNIENIEFSELLDLLESQTSLKFDIISKDVIIIAPKSLNNKICGYILDYDTNLPIPYALITSTTGDKVASDVNGFFSIHTNDNNSYSVSSAGYIDEMFNGNKNCQQIYLTRSNELLDEVIISGYVTSGIDRKRDGSIDVNSNALGILPGLVSPDLLQSIQIIPGINSLDESASGIQIRGGTPDQNLILFDDIKLFNIGHFYGMFSTLNPYATQKASIFKSGTSAVYGDRISGIIDITSGEKIPDKTEFGFGIDGLSIDGFVKTPLSNKLAFYVFGRRSYTDLHRSATYESYADKIFRNTGTVRNENGDIINVPSDDEYTEDSSSDSFSFHDINTKLIFKPNSNNTFILSGLTTRNAIDFSFSDDGETKVDDLITTNIGLSFKWKHQTSQSKTENISLYFSNYESTYFNKSLIGSELDERNTRNNFITDVGLNLKIDRRINQLQNITFGYQISNSIVGIEVLQEELIDTIDNIDNSTNTENLKNALFVEYNYNSKKSSVVGLGLRTVHYSSLGDIFLEPRINTEWNLIKGLWIKGSIERRHQPISQIIEFDQGELRLENSTWRLSNKSDSPILRSDQISTGILFDKNNWTIDLDLYYKELTGLTTFTNGFGNPEGKFDDGESIVRGIDVLIKKRINNYRVWAGYTYNNIRFDFPNIQVGDFPGNNDISHSFRVSNTFHLNNFEISLAWQYRTGAPYTPIRSFDEETSLVSYGKINSARLKDYHRMDASAIYNFKINKSKNIRAQLGLSILNLYNRKIPISYTYITEDEGEGSELQQVIQRFSLGLTPNASFRVFF